MEGSAHALDPPRYRVLVDDNFRYEREDERWEAGRYGDYDAAVAKCIRIVDECLEEAFEPGMRAEQLLATYKHYGEDPWIAGDAPPGRERFSAWEYAAERAMAMCARRDAAR